MADTVFILVDDTTALVSPWRADLAQQAKLISVMGGIEALARLRENPGTALVIINLSLQRVNGMDALIKIREKNKAIPIIILANPLDRKQIQNALAYQVQDLMPLPVNTGILLEKIAKCLKTAPPPPAAAASVPAVHETETNGDAVLSGIKEKYYRAQSCFANGDLNGAIELFSAISNEKILKDVYLKYVEESYYQTGRCLLKKGDPEKAVEVLKQFISKAPKSLLTRQALFQIGAAYEMMKDPPKAVNFYTKVITLTDTDSLATQARKRIEKLNG